MQSDCLLSICEYAGFVGISNHFGYDLLMIASIPSSDYPSRLGPKEDPFC